jgi:hypothetical protein
VVSSTASLNKPDRGTLKTLVEVTNQAGVKVMVFYTLTRIPTHWRSST